ncbi:MAG: uroporphyrinogen decarboxylase family protein, partial [Acidobacteriota bacterium]|nr:uroporphyrinogen decarboxylase family protein [Acidobacteriota bacterium]
QKTDRVPISLIIDSPWIPGYLGIKHIDYYFDQEVWFRSNLRIVEEFPEVTVLPSWWVEYGMAIEPSAMGGKVRFPADQTPSESPMLFRLEDLDQLAEVDPQVDGLMPVALRQYRAQKRRITDAGYTIPMVAARGPLALAVFFRGLTPFMMDITDNPAGVHKLLAYTTNVAIEWLKAQAEAVGDSVEGILVLDDIVGFLSRKHYQEFAHPYLQEVFSSFPSSWVKVYHNDARIDPFLEDLPDAGFDVLNWTHKLEINEVRKKTAGRICLMGNVSPLDIGVRGTPAEVKAATLDLLQNTSREGLILSLGGGVSPGMPGANIHAMIEAVTEFNG